MEERNQRMTFGWRRGIQGWWCLGWVCPRLRVDLDLTRPHSGQVWVLKPWFFNWSLKICYIQSLKSCTICQHQPTPSERGPWSSDPGLEAINMMDPAIFKCIEDTTLMVWLTFTCETWLESNDQVRSGWGCSHHSSGEAVWFSDGWGVDNRRHHFKAFNMDDFRGPLSDSYDHPVRWELYV